MKRCSSASRAVSVRRGSTTKTFAPRARISRRARPGFGTWRKLHFEMTGFAPTITRQPVWSRSGKGCVKGNPYISLATANLFAQSWVAEENIEREPIPVMNPWAKAGWRTPNPAAVPTYIAIASGPCASRMRRTRPPMSPSASSQLARCQPLPVRRSGARRRSGEAYIRAWRSPFGQAKPSVATCRAAGRTLATAPPRTSTSSPQRTSQMRQKVAWVPSTTGGRIARNGPADERNLADRRRSGPGNGKRPAVRASPFRLGVLGWTPVRLHAG
jgi:hypothetical protein